MGTQWEDAYFNFFYETAEAFAKFLDNRLIKTRNVSLRPMATPEELIQGKTEKNC